ncbi:serine/threonine-protein kinase [Actinomadura alba]|uniref:non-specific serine/threonine protein kinase n=1 Tax=Actinomadura alba TaxID=406431 RepID=A0ABR7LVC0_9ACTN|nr:serine/threonine-protein kinase [Actinomadura alba]MBC6468796.1 protein kinase [Actinomadura alba]
MLPCRKSSRCGPRTREELAADPRVRERFMKEIAAARRVDPFCIAQVLDASLDGPRPYIVTEYVDGPSLQQAGPRGSAAAVQRLAVATATALAAIHDAGIVHRDFKPSNVLLAPDGPRIIDFGIARDTEAPLTVTSGIIGTPAYMAPEQFEGRFVGAPADVFAWASVVAFATTGRPPFGANSFPAIMNRVLQGQPDLGDLAEPLRSVVTSCLAKDPADRPTMRDVMMRLVSVRSVVTAPQAPAPPLPGAAVAVPSPGLRQQPPVPVPVPVPQSPLPSAPPPGPRPPETTAPGTRRPAPGRRRLALLAGAGGAAVLTVAVTMTVLFWPNQSEADSDENGADAVGAASGADSQRQGVVSPTASGSPTNGTTGEPSPGASSPGSKPKSGTGSGSSPRTGTGSGSSPGTGTGDSPERPASPAPTKSSGGGGGGGGIALSVFGTKSGSCYTKAGYRYTISYPNPSHQLFQDGSMITDSSQRSFELRASGGWTSGTHRISVYMDEPNVVDSVTFTAC